MERRHAYIRLQHPNAPILQTRPGAAAAARIRLLPRTSMGPFAEPALGPDGSGRTPAGSNGVPAQELGVATQQAGDLQPHGQRRRLLGDFDGGGLW